MVGSNVYKVMSCMQCRKRKTRCDRKIPCGSCRVLGKASECVPMTRSVVSQPGHSQSQNPPDGSTSPIPMSVEPEPSSDGGHARLNHIETLLQDALNEVQTLTRRHRQQDEVNEMESYVDSKRQRTGSSCDDVDTSLDRLNLLSKVENTVMGFTSENEFEFRKNSPNKYDGAESRITTPVTSSVDMAIGLLQLIPGQQACILVNYYFESIDWFTRVLSPTTSRENCLRLARMTPREVIESFSLPQTCCYLIILAISLYFASGSFLSEVNISLTDAETISDSLITGCQAILWKWDFACSHELDFLSCTIIKRLYQHRYKKVCIADWAIYGAEVKVAQNLGCHRIDALKPGENLCPPWSSCIEREVGRRIYWSLIWYDWSHATVSGVYSIHPSQTFTRPPGNIYITDDARVVQRDISVYTPSTYTVFRIKYVEVCRQVTDLSSVVGGKLDVDQVRFFGAALDAIHSSIPDSLKYNATEDDLVCQDGDRARVMERCMLEIMYQNRMLRLHRKQQIQGSYQPAWYFAKSVSIDAATRIVQIISRICDDYPELLKYYLVTYYLFGAAMTLMIELCCKPREATKEAQFYRNYVTIAKQLLGRTRDSSYVARISENVLHEILAAEDSVRGALIEEEGEVKFNAMSLNPENRQLVLLFRGILENVYLEERKGFVNEGKYAPGDTNSVGILNASTSTPPPVHQYGAHDPFTADIMETLDSIMGAGYA